jgi:NACHT domain-containing protein/calcineurin-like phosphoesterase family protein
VRETLVADLRRLPYRPDLVFFTGDAAFGHLGDGPGESIAEQFEEAARFLDAVRQAFTPEIPRRDLYLVPGNHDVDRRKVSKVYSQWLEVQNDLASVRQLIQDAGEDWKMILRRLAPYQTFLAESGLDHLLADRDRAIWAEVRTINGLRVGLAGFNSAWSCGRDKEKGRLWAAGDWQRGTLREKIKGADFSIALVHHPPDWLVEHESGFRRTLRQDFKFLLHGHEHQDWVTVEDDGFTTISAAACYDRSDRENGYNLVRLDPESGSGQIWLRQYSKGGGWVARPIYGQAGADGIRTIDPWPRRRAASPQAIFAPRPPAPTAGPPGEELARYLECLRSAHRHLPVAGFATRVRIPIRLESVYVPLRARLIHHAMENDYQKPGTLRELAGEGEEREVAFDEALPLAARHGFSGAVVLGDPGSGKTTLLKHFLLSAPDRLGLPPETVPVFIELRRLKDPAAGLLAALTEAVERADETLAAPAFARALLRRDHLLFLIDGLDEIADPRQRAEVSGWLEEAVGKRRHSTFVVTSRYAGYKGDARLTGRFLKLHVRDLAEAEARRFIGAW